MRTTVIIVTQKTFSLRDVSRLEKIAKRFEASFVYTGKMVGSTTTGWFETDNNGWMFTNPVRTNILDAIKTAKIEL